MQSLLWNMYSCIQNGLLANRKSIICPSNKFCVKVLSILYKEGLINGFRFFPTKVGMKIRMVEIFLKYNNNNKPVIQRLISPSKPGRRLYACAYNMWKNQSSFNSAILSTSKGVYSSKDCRRFRCGGELLGLFL